MPIDVVFAGKCCASNFGAHGAHPTLPWKAPSTLPGPEVLNVIPDMAKNMHGWRQARCWAQRLHAGKKTHCLRPQLGQVSALYFAAHHGGQHITEVSHEVEDVGFYDATKKISNEKQDMQPV